ncbi:MAG: hypothetical protein CMF31_06970 [Kordiimonas sp.]|nr:hypothetical protein [Kordiimonas sp.]|tara:strand:- start:3712 stop:5184 length:1473 start_codon:yes stop_codon:yes gene_type:complete
MTKGKTMTTERKNHMTDQTAASTEEPAEQVKTFQQVIGKLSAQAQVLATQRKRKPTSYYARFLSRAILLEEVGPPRMITATIAVISFFILSFFVWSAVTPLQETSMAKGQILPQASVQPVQHLEGGIIANVMVKEGDIVRAGDPLMKLAPVAAMADLDQMLTREASLSLQAERLRAFALERDANFAPYAANYPQIVRDQSDVLDYQNKSRMAQKDVLIAQINERDKEYAVLVQQEETQRESLRILTKETDIHSQLRKKGLGSELKLLAAKRALNQAQGELQATLSRQASIKASIKEAESRVLELDATLRNEALAEMGRVSTELAELRKELSRHQDRVARLTVTAPSNGVVKGLQFPRPGGVVAPGDLLMELVPEDRNLIAEVKISPRDIGHVKKGTPVLVKVDTYNYARFGGIAGTLDHVSASSFMDEKGETYFKGVVQLPQTYVGQDPRSNAVTSGMTVVADIRSGEKTLLQYLIKPIHNALSSSFTER